MLTMLSTKLIQYQTKASVAFSPVLTPRSNWRLIAKVPKDVKAQRSVLCSCDYGAPRRPPVAFMFINTAQEVCRPRMGKVARTIQGLHRAC